jgi:hypothetical protein
MPKLTLYVVQAFDTDANGELIARGPQACSSASLAKRTAENFAKDAAGVIAPTRAVVSRVFSQLVP